MIILAVDIFLLFVFGAIVSYAILVWKAKKLETRGRHYQWLWDGGLHESARIVDPDLANWLEP